MQTMVKKPIKKMIEGVQSSVSSTMNVKDSLPRKKSSNSRLNKQNVSRVLSQEYQPPSTDLLRSRCDGTQMFCALDSGGSRVRSQSEIIYSLQDRDGFLISRDNERFRQDFCLSNGRNFNQSKLPKINQGDGATNNHIIGDWKAIATESLKRSRSMSVLPNITGRKDKVVKFRPTTPLTKEQVEDLDDKVAAFHNKSHDLAKWLRDQQ